MSEIAKEERPAQIIDQDNSRNWRTELPNIVDEMDLDPYEFRLYCHLKRVTGARGGSCWESTKTLAKNCKMSEGKISAAKKSLVKKGLILIKQGNKKDNETDKIFIIDIWEKNFAHYKKKELERLSKQGSAEGVHNMNEGVHHVNRGVHNMNEGVHHVNERKNHIKKEPTEEKIPLPPTSDLEKPKLGSTGDQKPSVKKSGSIHLNKIQIREQQQFLEWSRQTLNLANDQRDDPFAVAWLINEGCDLLTGIKIFEDLLKNSGYRSMNWTRVKEVFPTHRFRLDTLKNDPTVKQSKPSTAPVGAPSAAETEKLIASLTKRRRTSNTTGGEK